MLAASGWEDVAWAQTQTAPPQGANPAESASRRLGILYLTPSISIDRLGYDSNVLNEAGDPKADFTATVTPQSKVWIPFAKRALLTTDLGVDFVYYKDSTTQRATSPRINAVGELYARRLTLTLEAGTARDFRQPNIEIETRVKQTTDTLGAGFRFSMLRGLSVGVAGYRRTNRFGDDAVSSGINLRDRLDRVEQGVRVAILEKLTSLTTVGLILETREDQFDRAADRNADGYRVAGTISLAEKAIVSGTAEIGYRHVNPGNPLVPDFSGLVARVSVANRFGGAFETSLVWDRDMQYSIDPARPYFVTNAVSARVRRQLAGQFDVSVGAARNRASYRLPLDALLATRPREQTMTYNADIGYRIGRNSRMAFGITRTSRTSTLADVRNYSTTFAGLSLNYVF